MAPTSDHYDIIVIGSGPGGASLAHRLASTGRRILMLERGDYLPRSRRNQDSKTVFVDAAYQAKETRYGSDGSTFHPGPHYFVGGNSKVYGSALFRLRERDFGELRDLPGVAARPRCVRAVLRIRYDRKRMVLHIDESIKETAGQAGGVAGAPGRVVASDRTSPLSRYRTPGRHQPTRCRSSTSVLALDCKAHELDNFYIADASFFHSIGSVNQTLTPMPSEWSAELRRGWAHEATHPVGLVRHRQALLNECRQMLLAQALAPARQRRASTVAISRLDPTAHPLARTLDQPTSRLPVDAVRPCQSLIQSAAAARQRTPRKDRAVFS